MLTEYLTETPRHWDRQDTVGASEIGMCARRVSYLKHEAEPDPDHEDAWGMKERGHWVEAWVVARLAANGAPVLETGDDQVTRTDGFLSATADGASEQTSFDVKSFDPRKSKLPEEMHILQVRLGARLNPKTDKGMLIYVNASDFEDQREFGPYPELTDDEFASLKSRARQLIAYPPEDHPREGYFTEECTRFDCPFRSRCIGETIEGRGKFPKEQLAELEQIREQYKAAKSKEEDAAKDKRRLQERVRQLFRASDVRKVTGKASISRQTRPSLDTEAMERDGIDLAPYRKDGRPFDVITIR